MKYNKKENAYYNSTKTNCLNMSSMVATSYGWWQYFKHINGVPVFNNYMYSNTTAKHQSNMRNLLADLCIVEPLVIQAPKGLQDLDSAIEHYEYLIKELETAIAKKGSRKATNATRKIAIGKAYEKIAFIKSLQVEAA